jgi:hypothetical protein
MCYICPVCGYDKLEKQPYDEKGNESFEICVCCAFEFGVDDMLYIFETYRKEWLSKQDTKQGDHWNLDEQLKNIEKIKPLYIPYNRPPKP